jgi:4-oxalocrotonate tautomerase
MPVVRIDLWKGREKETKKKLIEKITSAVTDAIGCSTEAVQVIINEVDKDNWGIGGTPASVKFPDK